MADENELYMFTDFSLTAAPLTLQGPNLFEEVFDMYRFIEEIFNSMT